MPEVLARDEAREQGAAGGVRERLGRAQHEEGDEHDRDVHDARDDHRREDDEDDRAEEVDPGDDPAPVEAVGDDAGEHAEQQVRQVLAQQRQRDEERVAGLRGDEQRPGGDRDPVADVVDDRRRRAASGSCGRAGPGRTLR